MTVLAHFVVDSETLPIGQIVRETPGLELEFERIVPTDEAIMPYFWVSSDNLDNFERSLAASSHVVDFMALDQTDQGTLYRVEWARDRGMLIEGFVETGGAVLSGEVDENEMRFVVRFADHDHLAQFYNYCVEHDIKLELMRVYSLTDRSERAREFGLTPEQREALVLAATHGYFSSPRETSMNDLADDLDISQQAMSQRIRRGTEKILLGALKLSRTSEE